MNNKSSVIVFSWDGQTEALKHVEFDQSPNFQILLFNYSGNHENPILPQHKTIHEYISTETEFKGSLIHHVCKHLKNRQYDYVGLLDDDQSISIGAINHLLSIAHQIQADVFHPSIKSDSYHSHPQFLQKPGSAPELMEWIEIMAPFLRKEIFEAGEEFYAGNISSYGLDKFLFPYLQRKLNQCRTFLVHDVAIQHLKPVTDGKKLFSNGLDARQEGEVLRKKILQRIQDENIEFTEQELKSIYEVGIMRWQKWKYDFKRLIGA